MDTQTQSQQKLDNLKKDFVAYTNLSTSFSESFENIITNIKDDPKYKRKMSEKEIENDKNIQDLLNLTKDAEVFYAQFVNFLYSNVYSTDVSSDTSGSLIQKVPSSQAETPDDLDKLGFD